ncbi:MAG: hypothetical protein HKN76_01060 [Saprospiraceae bacterium]|nr:hypothetical protein [Saprospiraceae bacterium]
MKRLFFLSIMALALSCQKEQDEPIISGNVLHYDGPNQSAPVLARGISYPLVKFPADEIQKRGLASQSLIEIEYYIDQNPIAAKILIFEWNDSTDNLPGTLLYEAEINNSRNRSWNKHTLSHPIQLPASGFWIAFEINAGNNDLRIMGCDPGPRHPFGDGYGLFGNNNEPGWTDFFEFSGRSVDINWNIRAVTD